jgi:parallel beta-helix repeat protein
MNAAAVQLNNQQGWEINNLEVVGGYRYGVYIAGIVPDTTYTYFQLSNLNVHGAHYTSVTGHDSGEIFFAAGVGDAFNDVVINGVSAHDSQVSEGIFVEGGDAWGSGILGDNITIQNSSAYNVYGDGILLQAASNGLLQNNVVYNTGLCPPNPGCAVTPSGLWELYCHTCTVQGNESSNQSWSPWDGGDYDIDVWNNNNVVQYNYGHDSVGYCVSVFSASNVVGTDNVIRYNVCSNNSHLVNSPDPGEIFMNTWDGGTLNGVQVYNNTFYWNPATPGPAFNTVFASYSGSDAKFFKNNIIYSTVPYLVQSTSDFALDSNIYWTVGTAPDWNMDGTDYTTLASYQSASGQDAQSFFTDPMLNSPTYHTVGSPASAFTLLPGSPALGAGADVCNGISGCSMGSQDFWGNPLPAGAGYNIGAWQ